MNRILKTVASFTIGLFALTLAMSASATAADPPLRIQVLSSSPNWVTNGDALVAVDTSSSVKTSKVVVRVNGKVVTSSFHVDPDNSKRLVGEVSGFANGRNVISAWASGLNAATNLAIFNSPMAGPVFSGPHQAPYYCTTQALGLDAPTDSDCYAPTKTSWAYGKTGGGFGILASPTDRPADLAQTTTRTGQTVDYVVRVETGVINRGVYQWAILAPNGNVGEGWNGRFAYNYGGGCSTGHQQGQGIPNVLNDTQLSRGYATMGSSLNVFNTTCNDVLSAETTSMVKEHVIESLGKRPVWTLGQGSSGGSVQVQMISQNYPGLLDGILPSASFPDNSSPDYPDCRLMQAWFSTPAGAALNDGQKEAVTGLSDPDGCSALANGADVVNATEGCIEQVVPPAVIFNPVTNPGGVRCTLWDNMINIYGADPATGYARRTYDNTGVQYGLKAMQDGKITINKFINLNTNIGGYDNNGIASASRSVADPTGLDIAYKTGRFNQGLSGYANVPVIDARAYTDNEPNVHQYINTYRMRARLDRFAGNHDNQVMFRAKGGPNVGPMNDAAIDILGTWLDNIAANTSSQTQREKLIAGKPSNAVDACWIGGNRIDGVAQIGADNTCETTYPPHSLPVNVAGRPNDSIVGKCQLKAIDPTDYPGADSTQLANISATFPSGVCDWSKPGVGEQPVASTNQSFGPAQTFTTVARKLFIKTSPTKVQKTRKGKNVKLTATMNPCPKSIWQKVTFERKVKKGKKMVWQTAGSKITTGSKCQASLTIKKVKKLTPVRAKATAITGFKGAYSPVKKIHVVSKSKKKKHSHKH